MPKQNRGPYILAAGAAAQLLTGIPAAWGVFQQPVMQGYGFSRGQAMLAFAVLVAAYGVGCAVGGLLQDARGPVCRAVGHGTAGGRVLCGGARAARERRAVSRRLQRARGAGQRVFSPGGAGVCAEVVSGQKGLGHRRGGRRHGAVRRVFYGVRQGCRRGVGHPGLLCRVRGGHARCLRRGGADFAGPAAQSAERPAAAGT